MADGGMMKPNPYNGTNGANGPMLSPEDLEKFFALGGQIGDDGMLIWPDFGTPSAGAMTAMNAAPPAPAWTPGSGTSPLTPPPTPSQFDDPIFGAHMGIRNPMPVEKDPLKKLGKNPFGKEPKPGLNLMVPGGASITNGMPSAAPMPSPDYTERDAPNAQAKNPYGGRYGRRQTQKSLNTRRR